MDKVYLVWYLHIYYSGEKPYVRNVCATEELAKELVAKYQQAEFEFCSENSFTVSREEMDKNIYYKEFEVTTSIED